MGCKGSEFYNSSFQKWLKYNDIEMYSTHNEGKYVAPKRFIRTLKNKICTHMTGVSKNVYIDQLDGIVNEYNNTYHRTFKMKPIEVKDKTYIDSVKEVNDKDSKFKVSDHIRISKYKNIFAKGYNTNWSEEGFVIKKVKNTVPWAYIINDLKHFMKKNCKKQTNKNLGLKKWLKEKEINYMSNGNHNSFNSWIHKKDIEWNSIKCNSIA